MNHPTASDLFDANIPNGAIARMGSAVECCTYTTTALVAMAAWLRSVEDEKGAALVLAFAERFAAHEVETP